MPPPTTPPTPHPADGPSPRLSRANVANAVAYLIARVVRGPGRTAPPERSAAFEGRSTGVLGTYLDRVRYAPTTITDQEVKALRAAGHDDDTLFELTVAAALGAASERLAAAAAALDEAFGPADTRATTDG